MEHLSSSKSHPPETGLVELHRELSQAWGIDFHRVCALVCQLTSSDWCSISELIARTLLSHWNVTHLLRRLHPWLERDQDQVRIRAAFHDAFKSVFDCSGLSHETLLTPYEVAAQASKEAAQAKVVLASMERIVNDLPIRPARYLDHVSATPLTCLKRALFLAKNYELGGATILLLGDHDLTSLALAQITPRVAITVVDSDERILDYIETVAAQRGWTIRTLFADLRIELPRSVEASCDLVFTDPPYTPEGMRLFLARGLESLQPITSARLLCCYGFSERHPGLGLKVQSVFHDLHLVTEAILPHFNRYRGAEAIASSAALYICRPTRRSLPAAQALKVDPRIYTQGNIGLCEAVLYPGDIRLRGCGCIQLSCPGKLVAKTRFHPLAVGNDGRGKSSQVGIRLDRQRPGQFVCEFKGLDGAGGSLVAASIRPRRLLHVDKILAQCRSNSLPV